MDRIVVDKKSVIDSLYDFKRLLLETLNDDQLSKVDQIINRVVASESKYISLSGLYLVILNSLVNPNIPNPELKELKKNQFQPVNQESNYGSFFVNI